MIWASGPDGGRVWFSAVWTAFTGRPVADEIGEGWADGVHPDDRADCLDAYAQAFANRERYEATFRLRRADGTYRRVVDRGEPRADESGTFLGYVGSCVDVSEAQELHEREAAYLASMQDGFFVVGEGGAVTEVNQRIADILRTDPDELLGTTVPYPWWPVDDPAEYANILSANEILLAKGAGEFDLVFRRADGTYVPVIVSAATMESTVAEGVRYVCTVKDVSERRSVELERDDLLARLDALLEHAPVGFAFVDRDLRFTRLNQPMADLVGIPVDAHLGRRIDEVGSDLWRQAEPGFRAVLETGDAVMDTELEAQTAVVPGLERAFLASYYPVRAAADGPLLGAGSLLVEITERKQFERGAFLVLQASELFSKTRDLDEILDATVSLAVPSFADSSHIYLEADRRGSERRVAVAHVLPEMVEPLLEADSRWPLMADDVLDPKHPHRAVLLSVVDDAIREGFVTDPEHRAVVERHGVVSVIVAPLIARGRRLGMLVLNYTKVSGRRYRAGDLPLAEELARRYAQALDGAALAHRATGACRSSSTCSRKPATC